MTKRTTLIGLQRFSADRRMRGCMTASFFMAWVCLARVPSAVGGDGATPDAAAILDKFVEVTGGKAAYERIENRVAKQRLVHVGMGFEDTVTDYRARPNLHYVAIESDAMGAVRQGCNGTLSWYWSENTGPLVEKGEARLSNLDTAAFDRPVEWRKYYSKVEYAGEETIDGRTCHKIILTPNHGEKEVRYYDQESHLLVQAEKTRLSSHMPPLRAVLTFDDYRAVDGLLIAYRTRHTADVCGNKREMLFVTESIEHNVDLPSDRFDPPEAVLTAALADSAASFVKRVVAPDSKPAARPPCATKGTGGGKGPGKEAKKSPCSGGR